MNSSVKPFLEVRDEIQIDNWDKKLLSMFYRIVANSVSDKNDDFTKCFLMFQLPNSRPVKFFTFEVF